MTDGLFGLLAERFPDLTGLVHSVRRSRTQVAYGEDTVAVRGRDYVEEVVGGLRYRVSADAFFQTNTLAAEVLYGAVLDLAGLTGSEAVLDLYAGSGGISLHLARAAGQVTGLEIVPAAVADAQANAAANSLTNCAFRAGDIRDRLAEAAGAIPPDLVVTDPPRAGMDPEVTAELLRLAPPRILYVSCNPATLGRDLGLLAAGYDIAAVRPVDLFPHTAHVETVLRLDRR
jgi:23S rRNA (uracil1939-C5)-methyltransferase